jgi:hypothetical protein
MKVKIRKYGLSVTVFALLLLALVWYDERVRDRFDDVIAGRADMSPLDDRLADLGDAVALAVRTQTVENGPLVMFATVGAVLFIFMFRT